VLMENAGRAAAMILSRLYPRGRVVALVGSGNNGGDALVMLRALRSWGRDVAWIRASQRSPDPGLLHGFDVPLLEGDAAARALGAADVVVDGMLGTGATGAPGGDAARWIELANAAGRPIFALDLPSGIDPTTGQVPGIA